MEFSTGLLQAAPDAALPEPSGVGRVESTRRTGDGTRPDGALAMQCGCLLAADDLERARVDRVERSWPGSWRVEPLEQLAMIPAPHAERERSRAEVLVRSLERWRMTDNQPRRRGVISTGDSIVEMRPETWPGQLLASGALGSAAVGATRG